MKRLIAMLAIAGCAPDTRPPNASETPQGILACIPIDEGGAGCCPGSPILIDLAGDGLHLTATEDGVLFELHAGRLGHWAWTQPGSDDAFLVLDRDGDGVIRDGGELFGDGTIQLSNDAPNGFQALAYFDLAAQGGNGDGVIDARDAVWPRLALWRDADHDAWSAPEELISVTSSGIRSFSLQAVVSDHVDEHGNEFRLSAPIVANAPIGRVASDVWLTQSPIPVDVPSRGPREPGLLTDISTACVAWVYSVDPGNPRSECLSSSVSHEPVIQINAGQRARRVSRVRTVINSGAEARRLARNAVLDLTETTCNNEWRNSYHWAEDPFQPMPYDSVGGFSEPRLKCWSTPVNDGGGCGG